MTRVNIIDFIARKLKALVGIVQDTDTATVNIAKGKYVIWKGNPCKASSAISSGGTLSASNLTALTEGVGNDINSNIASLMVSSGSFSEVQSIGTSGTYQSYTVPSDGFYTVRVSLGGGATSTCLARIAIGNNIMFNIIASLAQYDMLQPTPLFFKKGTEIKGLAIFPSHGTASIVRVA